jgi:hypothetical protein
VEKENFSRNQLLLQSVDDNRMNEQTVDEDYGTIMRWDVI